MENEDILNELMESAENVKENMGSLGDVYEDIFSEGMYTGLKIAINLLKQQERTDNASEEEELTYEVRLSSFLDTASFKVEGNKPSNDG